MFEIFNFTIRFVVQASRETKRKKKQLSGTARILQK